MNLDALNLLSLPEYMNLFTDGMIRSFDCGDDDLNDFFWNEALLYHEQKFAATHVVYSDTGVVAYFTLTSDCLHKQRVASDDVLNNYPYTKYPALKIARLAVDKNYQRGGVGKWCMKNIFLALAKISTVASFRFITVDAKHKDDVVEFYKRFGFRQVMQNTATDTVPMYIDYFSFYTEFMMRNVR